jgi:hypothetical protein
MNLSFATIFKTFKIELVTVCFSNFIIVVRMTVITNDTRKTAC